MLVNVKGREGGSGAGGGRERGGTEEKVRQLACPDEVWSMEFEVQVGLRAEQGSKRRCTEGGGGGGGGKLDDEKFPPPSRR